MKRLVVCCDGTWQELGRTFPTNVAKIAAAVTPFCCNGVAQSVYYASGVGTNGWWNKIFGGGFGAGIDFNIKDAYRFLCLNYQPSDEIYLFGFSRGAYTVRSLAGLIYNSGLLRPEYIDKIEGDEKNSGRLGAYSLYRKRGEDYKPNSLKAIRFRKEYCVKINGCTGDDEGRVPITLLACWDTVGSLGIPPIGFLNPEILFPQWLLERFRGRYRFYDTRLSCMILNALHAVAIDERRRVFNVTPMRQDKDPKKLNERGETVTITGAAQTFHQIWFPGRHGCLGGGEEKLQGMSDAALVWMMEQVKGLGLGLTFDLGRVPFAPDPSKFDYKAYFGGFDMLVLVGWLWRKINKDADFERDVHESAKLRWRDLSSYRPDKLRMRFKEKLDEWAEQHPA